MCICGCYTSHNSQLGIVKSQEIFTNVAWFPRIRLGERERERGRGGERERERERERKRKKEKQ